MAGTSELADHYTTMTDDESQLRADIPTHLKNKLDADQRTNKEIIIELLEHQYENEKYQLQKKLAEAQATLEKLDEKRNEVKNNIEGYQSRIEEIEEEEQDYADWLDSILDDQENKTDLPRLIKGVIRNKEGYEQYSKGEEQIQADLKERSNEQERNIPEEEFRPMRDDSSTIHR